jgi:hypothetical protein
MDAGKPESVYTSHFVKASKEENASIVCPTLLSQECRYCKKNGHTVKYCKVLEKDNNRREKQTKSNQVETKKQENTNKKNNNNNNKNVYMALCDSDDEEEIQQPKAMTHSPQNIVPTYASIAAKAHEDEQIKEKEKQTKDQEAKQKQIKEQEQKTVTRVLPFQPIVRPIKKYTSWADSDNDIDSDEDEEEQEENFMQVASF